MVQRSAVRVLTGMAGISRVNVVCDWGSTAPGISPSGRPHSLPTDLTWPRTRPADARAHSGHAQASVELHTEGLNAPWRCKGTHAHAQRGEVRGQGSVHPELAVAAGLPIAPMAKGRGVAGRWRAFLGHPRPVRA